MEYPVRADPPDELPDVALDPQVEIEDAIGPGRRRLGKRRAEDGGPFPGRSLPGALEGPREVTPDESRDAGDEDVQTRSLQ